MIARCELANENCFLYGYVPPEELATVQSHGCFKDEDHIVPKRLIRRHPETAMDRLHNDYILRSPDNIRLVCRGEHERRNKFEERSGGLMFEVPSLQKMSQILLRNIEDGDITIPKKHSPKYRTPEAILADIHAFNQGFTEDYLIQRAAEHVFAARQSA